MQTATLDSVTIKLELFGKSIYRLLGERVVVDENGNITSTYSNLPEGIKISKRKILPMLDDKKSAHHQRFDFYELSFSEKNFHVVFALIYRSDDNLLYSEKNKTGKFYMDNIGNNAISMHSNYMHAFVPEKI